MADLRLVGTFDIWTDPACFVVEGWFWMDRLWASPIGFSFVSVCLRYIVGTGLSLFTGDDRPDMKPSFFLGAVALAFYMLKRKLLVFLLPEFICGVKLSVPDPSSGISIGFKPALTASSLGSVEHMTLAGPDLGT